MVLAASDALSTLALVASVLALVVVTLSFVFQRSRVASIEASEARRQHLDGEIARVPEAVAVERTALPARGSRADETQAAVPHVDAAVRANGFQLLGEGDEKATVLAVVGQPDSVLDHEWIYRLDDHSGYAVSFNSDGRVARASSWKS
jgi:hypothetical protein